MIRVGQRNTDQRLVLIARAQLMNIERFSTISTSILVICAVTISVLVVRREVHISDYGQSLHTEPTYIAEWATYAREGQRMGSSDALVTIVVFSDYQCPACRDLARSLQALRQKYSEKLSVVYRHWPLATHPFAVAAAIASECASMQGQFDSFHNALFSDQDAIGITPWEQFAHAAGLSDMQHFEACVNSGESMPKLRADTLAGRRMGVKVTPTLLINGIRINGAPPYLRLEAHVEQALTAVRTDQ